MTVVAPPDVPVVPSVAVDGSELDQTWADALVEARVERGMRVAGRALLRFSDPDLELVEKEKMKLGADVVVTAPVPGQGDLVLLDGVVTGVGLEQSSRHVAELVVVVHDRAHSLGRGSTVKAHQQKTAADLVREVCGPHGLKARPAAGPAYEYLLHADTDLELLDRLADREGADWWVEGKDLHFAAAGTTVRPTVVVELGVDLVELSVRASGLHANSVRVTGWDRKTKAEVVGVAEARQAKGRPQAPLLEPYVSPSLSGKAELRTSVPPVATQAEATALAEALRDDLVSAALSASGTVLNGARLGPGTPLEVKGPKPVQGTYVVTSVDHVFRDGDMVTRFTAGDRRPSSLVETLGRRTSASHHQAGLVVGVVTNLQDPDKLGRVRVQLVGRSEEQESHWARVLHAGAGDKRGLVVHPEVNDEVLVGFENGDLRQPVVLGGLYGGKAALPEVGIAQEVRARSLTSRLGHVVELSDGPTPDAQYAMLQLEGAKHRLKIAKDAVELVMPGGVPFTLKVGDNGLIAFDATGSLTIKAVNVTLEAKGAIKVDGKATLDLASVAPLTIDSKAMTTLKSSGLTSVESTGATMVKGTPVAIN